MRINGFEEQLLANDFDDNDDVVNPVKKLKMTWGLSKLLRIQKSFRSYGGSFL